MKTTLAALVGAAGMLVAGSASAAVVTFDFEEFDPLEPNQPVFTTYSDGFATLFATGKTLGYEPAPNGSNSAIGVAGGGVLQATFASTVAFVSVDVGDGGFDADELYMMAFDLNNDLVETVTASLAAGVTGTQTLQINRAGIAKVFIGSWDLVNGGEFDNSVNFDNFSYAQATPTPEPTTWAMMLLGFGGAGALIRRRRPLAA